MSGVTRCGLDLEHEPHEHPGGSCDGHVMDLPDLQPGDPVTKLFTIAGTPLAWSWSTLTLTQARELRDLLDGFVTHYNLTFAVLQAEIIPACWPLHRGLAHDLAALYAQWVHVHQSGLATPADAVTFYDRLLPGFRTRMPAWLGDASNRCSPTLGHRGDWNKAAEQLPATRTGLDPQAFDDAVEDALLAYTRSPAHLTKDG